MRRQPCRRREKKEKKKKSPSSNLFQFLLPSTPVTKLINLSLVAVFPSPRLSSIFPWELLHGGVQWRDGDCSALADLIRFHTLLFCILYGCLRIRCMPFIILYASFFLLPTYSYPFLLCSYRILPILPTPLPFSGALNYSH